MRLLGRLAKMFGLGRTHALDPDDRKVVELVQRLDREVARSAVRGDRFQRVAEHRIAQSRRSQDELLTLVDPSQADRVRQAMDEVIAIAHRARR